MNKQLKQLEVMFDLQDKLNSKINSNWKEANYNWLRASWIECAELMDFCNWKWWKKQTLNLPQAKIEVVDTFHFLISDWIINDISPKDIVEEFTIVFSDEELQEEINDTNVLELIENLACSILKEEMIEPAFVSLCYKFNLSIDELYKLYIGKNVLNIFRQDHGYKEGAYIKKWPSPIEPLANVEDNVYLELFMDESETVHILNNEPEKLYNYLYSKLEECYPTA